jgi:hypothetical protein
VYDRNDRTSLCLIIVEICSLDERVKRIMLDAWGLWNKCSRYVENEEKNFYIGLRILHRNVDVSIFHSRLWI